MPEPGSNIFLTTENLAFSMPLLLVCGVYVYFKYIPLQYGALGIAVAFVLYQIRSQMTVQHEKKLTNLDENAIRDLIGDDDDDDAKAADEATKQKVAKVQARLAWEAKQEAQKANSKKNRNKKKQAVVDDDEEVDDLLRFAKGSRPVKAKKN